MVLDAFRLAKITKKHKELLELHSVQGGRKWIRFLKKVTLEPDHLDGKPRYLYLWSWNNLLIMGPRLLKEKAGSPLLRIPWSMKLVHFHQAVW